jgi:type I restriction enzyme S subunit
MSWVEQPLEMIAKCELGKMLDKNKNKGEYEIYLSNVDVRWGYFEMDELKKMRFETREFERYSLNTGDIIMCEGGEAGRCAIWKNAKIKMMYQKALHRIRTKKNIDSGFLFYQFLNMGNNGKFEAYYTGATIKHLPLQILKKIPISIAPLQTQKRIADILSAYDDLIENNLKRIKLLEQAAQNIYKEWFINMRFPGHKNAAINEETRLPKGWAIKNFDDVFEFQNGFAFYTLGYAKTKTSNIIVDLGNISEQGSFVLSGKEKFVSDEIYSQKERYHLRKYDVIIAMTDVTARLGILAKVGIIDENNKYILNQRVGRIRSKIDGINHCFVNGYFGSYEVRMNLHQKSKGSVQQYFNTKDIKDLKCNLPSQDIISKFDEICSVFIDKRINLNFQNQKLKAARDILLPRLMNRTIEV